LWFIQAVKVGEPAGQELADHQLRFGMPGLVSVVKDRQALPESGEIFFEQVREVASISAGNCSTCMALMRFTPRLCNALNLF
jgi:hypothetical protein